MTDQISPSCRRLGVTVLASGSKGNATIVQYGEEAIMVDAGLSARETEHRMEQTGFHGELLGILVSHEHTDHVGGLCPCAKHFDTQVLATRPCSETLHYKYKQLKTVFTFVPGSMFPVGPFQVHPFSVPHDANDPVAFTIECAGRKIAIATDFGFLNAMVEYQLQDCDMMVVESNHDLNMLAASTRPWSLKQRIMGRQGHLSNEASAQLLEKTIAPNTRNVVLAHLSHECNTAEKAGECAARALHNIGREDIQLDIALQDSPLQTIWLD